ncbi:DUF4832 domain-containing protein [Photobacterium kishitanii]|uniref:DUF4832 domain-containing protein n=1 Tax=Photobacterium kishitanii TaxID=318456 RepID=UPI000D166DA6|nr:DUF4832 domain-containing protein [Photobacterium kishitanii]PSU91828.1 DUF4832 domain-containing protein [Photobacterium kishitanii]
MLKSTKKAITSHIPSFLITLLAKTCLFSFTALPLTNIAVAQPITQITTPTIIDDVLINPDIGITDHQSFNIHGDPWWNKPSHPETSVVYFRWYWEELEPQPGHYNFQLIDDTINQAAALGKKTVIRFMTMAGKDEVYYNPSPNAGKKILGVPCWIKKQIDDNTIGETCADDNHFVVDYKNPILKKKLSRFIKAMGKRYNNNANILRLDVGLIGTWGEWNLASQMGYQQPSLGHHGYNVKDLAPYIQLMRNAFPDKQLSIDLTSPDDEITGYAIARGLGWRADCIGDWQAGWNHMENGYPDTINHILGNGYNQNNYADTSFLNRWKQAPVDFEVCQDLDYWSQNDNDYTIEKVKQTFDFALDSHASLFNIKSGNVPLIYKDLVNDLIKKLGYRFEISSVEISSRFKPASAITIASTWKNTGVAPSYNNYPVVWRLRNNDNHIVTYFETNNDIRTWLPANDRDSNAPKYKQINTFNLPYDIKPGNYKLEVALVEPSTTTAKIKLGIDGRTHDNWHYIDTININH